MNMIFGLFKSKVKLKDDKTIDFTVKRLGLTHNPQVKTIQSKASLNEKAEAILQLKDTTGVGELQLWKGI